MLDKNPETRIGVPDIKVLGWAGPQNTGLGFPVWGALPWRHVGAGLGLVAFGPSRGLLVECPGPLLAGVCHRALTLPVLSSTVAPLGDQEWGGAPSLGRGALQHGGGDGGGGEELGQAHTQLDHGGKWMGAEVANSWEGLAVGVGTT